VTLKVSEDKATELETRVSEAQNKIHSLRHDYQFAAQGKAHLEGQLKQLQTMRPRQTKSGSDLDEKETQKSQGVAHPDPAVSAIVS